MTIRHRRALSDADIQGALRRADRRHGLLAIPQPPRWPLYAALALVFAALAGIAALRHADLRFVRFTCDANMEGCR